MHHGFLENRTQESLPNAIFVNESTNWTCLHEAAARGDEKHLELLLASNVGRCGSYIMSKEATHGNTPLHVAASRGFSRCVKLICSPPSSSSTCFPNKQKSKKNVGHTIEILHNCSLGIGNKEGLSALHLAVQNGHNQSCRELLLAGAEPDVQNNYGDTPLHTACRYGHAGGARILISASCDPDKSNLNGDTPLHITSAMGRRKLTRILLEANARTDVKNQQGETAVDIARRKNYFEILDLFNNLKTIPSEKKKNMSRDILKSNVSQLGQGKTPAWSPYGCHYYPDPGAFPSPKFETVPREPLGPGEQYFLDLAGNIHKGPISIANTCYCGPFFRHMENQLNWNKLSLKKYFSKTKDRLNHKVQALAIKTNDQIEHLTQTVIADRIRCENNRHCLHECLKQIEQQRSMLSNKNQQTNLFRCRSVDVLDTSYGDKSELYNSKSFDMLEGELVEVTIHKKDLPDRTFPNKSFTDELDVDSLTTNFTSKNTYLGDSQLNELKVDFFNVSKRLGDLLEKTTLIIEKDNDQTVYKEPTTSLCRSREQIPSKKDDSNLKFSKDPTKPRHLIGEKASIISSQYWTDCAHSHASNQTENFSSLECKTASQQQSDVFK